MYEKKRMNERVGKKTESFILKWNAATVKNDLKAYRYVWKKRQRNMDYRVDAKWNFRFVVTPQGIAYYYFFFVIEKIEKSVAFNSADAAIPSVYVMKRVYIKKKFKNIATVYFHH